MAIVPLLANVPRSSMRSSSRSHIDFSQLRQQLDQRQHEVYILILGLHVKTQSASRLLSGGVNRDGEASQRTDRGGCPTASPRGFNAGHPSSPPKRKLPEYHPSKQLNASDANCAHEERLEESLIVIACEKYLDLWLRNCVEKADFSVAAVLINSTAFTITPSLIGSI
jgi:hypothetical protein